MKKLLTICAISSVMMVGTGCADHNINSKKTKAKLKDMTHKLTKTQHSALYKVCHPVKGKTCADTCQTNIHDKHFYQVYKKGCIAMGYSSDDCGPGYASIGCPKFCKSVVCGAASHSKKRVK